MTSCKVGFSSWDALVLAGGRSRRMGRDKATLRVQGMPLLELQLRRAREAGARALWASLAAGDGPGPHNLEGVGILRDASPDPGPWPGLLGALRASDAEALLVLAVDLPALTVGFLRRMTGDAGPGEGRIPQASGGLEPLCAIYPRLAALRAAESPWDGEEPSPRRLACRGLAGGWMQAWPLDETDAQWLVNWNQPADWSPTNP